MKTKKFIVLASLLLVLAMVAACGVTEQPNVDATPTEGTSTPSPDANVADPHEPLGCERDGKVFDAVYAANEYSDGKFKVVITGWIMAPMSIICRKQRKSRLVSPSVFQPKRVLPVLLL